MFTRNENRTVACAPPLAPVVSPTGGRGSAALDVCAAARDRPMGVGAINRLPSVRALSAGELLRGGGVWPAWSGTVEMWP
jgi:hypothetical protein